MVLLVAGALTAEEIRDVNTRYHDAAAAAYDAKWGIDFGVVGREQVTLKLTKALGRPPPHYARSLEIGAGTGYFTLNMLRAGLIDRATCSDISPGMLGTLQTNARRLGLRVDAVRLDAERLPFGDGSFDLVLGHAVLHHIPDLPRAFAEFARVLAPGGTVLFAGEPSRYGDRISRVPKRLASALAYTPSLPASFSAPPRGRGCARCAWRARSSWPTGLAGPTARSRRALAPRRSPGCGVSTPTAGICACRRSTGACSSPSCRRGSSTT